MNDYQDSKSPLNKLGEEILAINQANGWDVTTEDDWPRRLNELEECQIAVEKLMSKIALIHSEASEATEAIRHADWANYKEEMADILIRTIDMMAGLGIDIDTEVVMKMAKNRTRGYKHGGKLA